MTVFKCSKTNAVYKSGSDLLLVINDWKTVSELENWLNDWVIANNFTGRVINMNSSLVWKYQNGKSVPAKTYVLPHSKGIN